MRACPVCPYCGSKKFKRINSGQKKVNLECVQCKKITRI